MTDSTPNNSLEKFYSNLQTKPIYYIEQYEVKASNEYKLQSKLEGNLEHLEIVLENNIISLEEAFVSEELAKNALKQKLNKLIGEAESKKIELKKEISKLFSHLMKL